VVGEFVVAPEAHLACAALVAQRERPTLNQGFLVNPLMRLPSLRRFS
jgi:hypothetical protein